MRSYMDCPACSCLIDAKESSCPFCGATLRSAGAPSWLTLGLALSLGMASVSCVDKNSGDPVGETVTDTQSSETTQTNNGGQTTVDPDFPDGVTYAGPDEEWTTSWGSSSTGPTTLPDYTTSDASTYAGPDETTTTDWTTTGDTDTDGKSTESSTTTEGSSTTSDENDSADASTYGGPDATSF